MGPGEDGENLHLFDASADGIGPRVSLITTLFALGEGWHDYHHIFPWDYAAAELGSWDQWNPTKLFIDTAAAFGLVTRQKRASSTLQEGRRLQMMAQAPRQLAKLPCGFRVQGWPFLRYRVPIYRSAPSGEKQSL